ncbi:MAG: DUF1028 domain-containing protein [Caldilineaceae bacterium]
MTFSITAWDESTGMTGVAVLTKFFAVGSLCPFARAGVGAVATQAFVNPTFGPRGLALLEQGIAVEDVVDILLKSDEGREHRQLHLVDSKGRTAAFTGNETVTWAGHRTFPYFSVAGNMLVGEDTILAMAEAYQQNAGVEFTERLLRALEAGQAAGGDKRGRQSATMYVMNTEVYPYLDLRVDDNPDPIVEMRRIFEEAKREYLPFKQFLPTKAKPAGIYDRKLIDEVIAKQAENDKQKAA